jgi:hypothetical protein
MASIQVPRAIAVEKQYPNKFQMEVVGRVDSGCDNDDAGRIGTTVTATAVTTTGLLFPLHLSKAQSTPGLPLSRTTSLPPHRTGASGKPSLCYAEYTLHVILCHVEHSLRYVYAEEVLTTCEALTLE